MRFDGSTLENLAQWIGEGYSGSQLSPFLNGRALTRQPLMTAPSGAGHHSSDTWRRYGYVEGLADDYRLLLIDLRAHGQSEGPHDAESYAMARTVGDIVGVLDHAGVERTLYYGYSGGGRMGFGLGVLAPERVAALAIGGAYPSNRRPPGLEARIAILRQGTEVYISHLESLYGDLPELWRRELEACDPLGLAAFMEANLAGPGLEEEV
ncbi:hypothetical protein BH23CHL2_BH23CHL2_27000 [soil metagenome]